MDSNADSEQPLRVETILLVLFKFVNLFVASLLLGLLFGLGTSWLLKVSKANSTPQVGWFTSMPMHASACRQSMCSIVTFAGAYLPSCGWFLNAVQCGRPFSA